MVAAGSLEAEEIIRTTQTVNSLSDEQIAAIRSLGV
jgi:hypothetical protein